MRTSGSGGLGSCLECRLEKRAPGDELGSTLVPWIKNMITLSFVVDIPETRHE